MGFFLQLVVHTPTHAELHTNQTGGRFEMIGPPRQSSLGHITFVSLWRFLALIFANVCLRFLPASWDRPGLSERSFWRCILKPLLPAGKGIRQKFNGVGEITPAKAPRSCKNTPRHTHSHSETSRRLWTVAPGDCTPWLPFIKTLFTLADKIEPRRNRLPGKDGCGTLHSCEKSLAAVARGHSQRFGGELVLHWGGNLVWGTWWKRKRTLV